MSPSRELASVDWRTAERSQATGECVEVGLVYDER